MDKQQKLRRRAFLHRGLALGVGAVGLNALAACAPRGDSVGVAALVLPPPEATSIRVAFATCDAPYWMADDFLHEEGFSGVRAFHSANSGYSVITGEADIGVSFANAFVGHVDADQPLIALAGVHPGCAELWARPGINTISDLVGKTVAVNSKTITFNNKTSPDPTYGFFVAMLGYVGIQAGAVNFVEIGVNASRLDAFVEGSSAATIARAEEGVLLRTNPRNPGKLILDTTMDKPWSQILCCLLLAHRDWVKTNPVAAKRATRAILRAADATAKDYRAAARAAIAKGLFEASPAITEQVIYDAIKDLSYAWREYEPEDSVRFYALRMSDAKLIRKTPQQIINESTDLAYFRRLRTELKA